LVCPCKGDRTVRHNEVRNRFFADAVEAGMRPEKEKAGLLPSRPAEDGITQGRDDRRPADIWLPRSPDGRGEALDFACTSGLKTDIVSRVLVNPNVVFELYEDYKTNYKDTGQKCEEQGFNFTPMVLEASSGAWSPSARRVLDSIARGQSASWNSAHNVTSLRIAQRMSVALHRENARAIMKRMVAPPAAPGGSGWADYVDGLDE
jgi:hypothetical protein